MIVTFYSFKGGVGRSMALANVALQLARLKARVLMVDWDLESPGLERFFPDIVDRARGSRGVIDMLAAYKTIAAAFRPEEGRHLFPVCDPRDYAIEVNHKALDAKGALWLLPPGKRSGEDARGYIDAVNGFDWHAFYREWGGASYFSWLGDELRQKYDAVLIDTRTGVTEMGRICTHQLADIVVLLCAMNQQCIQGTLEMVDTLLSPKLQEARGRPGPKLLVVPARVEDRAEMAQMSLFQRTFQEAFDGFVSTSGSGSLTSFWDLRVPYVPYYSYGEELAVGSGDASKEANPLESCFARLADQICASGHLKEFVDKQQMEWQAAEVRRLRAELADARGRLQKAGAAPKRVAGGYAAPLLLVRGSAAIAASEGRKLGIAAAVAVGVACLVTTAALLVARPPGSYTAGVVSGVAFLLAGAAGVFWQKFPEYRLAQAERRVLRRYADIAAILYEDTSVWYASGLAVYIAATFSRRAIQDARAVLMRISGSDLLVEELTNALALRSTSTPEELLSRLRRESLDDAGISLTARPR